MRPIATDTNDFPSLRKDGKIYVDKTEYIHRMVANSSTRLFFISRPRRFGKSLTLSVLKALFSGRRELFEGLYIDAETNWEWETYPIIHFEFNDVTTMSIEAYERNLANHVRERLEAAGYSYDKELSAHENFGKAITSLSAANGGKGVVILIDEYDAPVGHCLDDIPKAEAVRDRLSDIYSQMKNRTGDIRFLLMTGISKFTRLSVFSALSNLVDVTQRKEYATMFGYTEKELESNFEEHLREHAAIMGKTYEEYRGEMRKWYNGYRFSTEDAITVYNPVSVALTLDAKERDFKATWATTGRSSMLMNYLKREDVAGLDYENLPEVAGDEFDVAELRRLKPIAMLFQAGYLTIKGYSDGIYKLGPPDEEVRRDLLKTVTGTISGEGTAWASSLGVKLITARWPDFFAGLKSLYAHMPYGSTEETTHEAAYQRILCTLLASQGFEYRAEDVQSNGSADVIGKHKRGIYIFELKVDESVDRAFKQIHGKGYAEPYRADPRPIWLVGLSFDSKTRRLVDCAAEKFSS